MYKAVWDISVTYDYSTSHNNFFSEKNIINKSNQLLCSKISCRDLPIYIVYMKGVKIHSSISIWTEMCSIIENALLNFLISNNFDVGLLMRVCYPKRAYSPLSNFLWLIKWFLLIWSSNLCILNVPLKYLSKHYLSTSYM